MRKYSLLFSVLEESAKDWFLFLFVTSARLGILRLGSSWSCSCHPTPQPQPCWIQSTSVTYSAAWSSARSLTHWKRPDIESTSLQRLWRVLTHWATMKTSVFPFFIVYFDQINFNIVQGTIFFPLWSFIFYKKSLVIQS